jgi:hypothetical protein
MMAVAVSVLNCRRWSIRDVAVYSAVAVVHGTDKNLLLPLLVPATASSTLSVSILLEKPVFTGFFGVLSVLMLVLLLPICLRIWAFSPLPSAAPAAMALWLTVLWRWTLGRLRLGLVLFCCHACTSWCVDIDYSVFPAESRCCFLYRVCREIN